MLTMRFMLSALILSLTVVGAAGAQSQQPPQAPQIQTKQQPKSALKDEEKSKAKENDTKSSIVSIPAVHPQSSSNVTERNTQQGSDEVSEFWTILGRRVKVTDSLLVVFTALLFMATLLLWWATKRLVKGADDTAERQAKEMQESLRISGDIAAASRESANVARDAMVAGERAFVFATNLTPMWFLDPVTGLYNWQFRPNWQNSGDTPTKNMTMHTGGALRDTPLPSGFNFNDPTAQTVKVLIPPKITILGGLAPPPPGITPQNILEIKAERKFLYLWGWARYFDIFPNTPEHITRFCWRILAGGDPIAFIPHSNEPGKMLIFNNLHHTEGNCADDECEQQGI